MELGHGIGRVLTLCLALGASSFIVGILPLSFTFSGEHGNSNPNYLYLHVAARQRSQLSTFGNGLLLGAALGVIIPELVYMLMRAIYPPDFLKRGAEALMTSRHEAEASFSSQIALSLLIGFAFMLVTEQVLASHASHSSSSTSTAHEFAAEEYDMRISDLDEGQLREPAQLPTANPNKAFTAYSLTFGLTIHSLADGLALGASSVGGDEDSTLSAVVFLALFIHKSLFSLVFIVNYFLNQSFFCSSDGTCSHFFTYFHSAI